MKPVFLGGTLAALIGCAGYGVAQTAQSISASDKAAGAKAHPQLLQEFGGAYGGPQASYVTSVGKKIAVQSGLANSQNDFTITLLNSPVNNAFAIPGGYVYVTRQLMGLMNDEAELASVLGHEIGHVAALHSKKRQTAATRNTVLGALGQILVGAVAGNSAIGDLLQRGVGQGAQLLTLKFSRKQEYEADDLGIRYLTRAGYDPYAAADMLASLNAQTSVDARVKGQAERSVPSWASTHPNGADRVRRARAEASQTGVSPAQRQRNRDAFLQRLDGMIYEDDPRQGVIEGRTFKHPDLKIAFTVPQGYSMVNGTSAVSITGSGGQAQFSGGAIGSGGLAGHVDAVYRGLSNSGIDYGDVRSTKVNGMDAAYALARVAVSSGQQVDVGVFAYQADPNSAYHFLTIVPAGSRLGSFESMINSFTRLTPAQAATIKPRVIDVVTVKAGDTLNSLASRMAYPDYRLDRFLALNGLASNSSLRPGQKVKLIVYG
jgi:predicted Zn-dependent protease